MSRLSDIEAELEALRMLVSDMTATLDAKEDGPVDEDVDKKRPGKKDVQDKQEGDAEAEALKKQEEDVEESAFDKFKNGPSALKEFKDETEKRRREFEEFTNGDVGLKQAFFNAPAALEEDVIIGPTHPNIINQIVREPVRFDLGIPKKEDERINAQPGFISLKAEDTDGKYFKYEVLGVKTGSELADPSVYTLPVATSAVLGGIKLGHSGNATDYDVKLNIENRAYVTVPIATSEYLGTVKIGYTQNNQNYPVELLNEQMFVNVPWANTTYSVGDGGLTQKNFTTTLNDKLDGIDAGAKDDQTDTEIRALVESATDSNVFTDTDHTNLNANTSKLYAIEAGANVTDTANVTSAGALMDSELTNIGAVKGINQNLTTSSDPTFVDLLLTGDLTVQGTTTTTNTETLNVTSLTVNVATNASNSSEANNAGLFITGASESLLWNHADTRFVLSDELKVEGDLDVAGNIVLTGTVDGRDVAADGAILNTINTNYVATITAGEGIDITTATGSGSTPSISVEDASSSNKGIASFSGDFSVSSGVVSLASSSVDTAELASNAVTTAKITDANVTTAKVADDAITSAKIAADAVGSSEIAADAVGASEIAADAVGSSEIASSAVSSSELATNAVTTVKITDANVTTAKVADDAITSAKIAADAVGASEIAADAVGSSEIAADAVGSSEIAADAVGSTELQTGAVATSKISSNAVTTDKILDVNVTTAKLADDAVTNAKLAANAVNTSQIADDAVTGAKLANDITIANDLTVVGDLTVDGDNITQYPSWVPSSNPNYLTAHPTISAASSSDNSGRTYIQDITLDSFGHITGIVTATETVVDTNTTYSVGDGGLTEKNFTSTLKNKLGDIADDADVTPSWVPSSDPSYASQSYVGTQITNLIGGAPGTLDTLKEISDSLNDDVDLAGTITNSLALKAPLASPALTGTPTAPTQGSSDNSTKIATTAYVTGAISSAAPTAGSNITINGTQISATNTTYSVGNGGLTQVNFTSTLDYKLGNIAENANNYSLPTATASVLGGVKIGTNISIDSGGVISATDTNTTYSVGDGGLTQKNFTTALFTRLSGSEDNATADQTGDEIKYLVENTSDSNVFTDDDHTKLNGIAASANNYSLTLATSEYLGGVKIGFTESGKDYPVELLNDQMFVNVPWTDTTYNCPFQLERLQCRAQIKLEYTQESCMHR